MYARGDVVDGDGVDDSTDADAGRALLAVDENRLRAPRLGLAL